VISLVAALIATGLYGHVGIKVLYNNILVDIFNAPPLAARRGELIYAYTLPIWWTIGFVIAAVIPDYCWFVVVIYVSTLPDLTYTIPPFSGLAYDIRKDGMRNQWWSFGGGAVSADLSD